MIFGLGLLLYPTVANLWNSVHQSRIVNVYVATVANISNENSERMWKEADAYNAALVGDRTRYMPDEEDQNYYDNTLNIDGTGIMSYIDIPKLRVVLPIYHGTDELVLQVAIGHIQGTSLPVGGESTHCVISGHRGLPSAKLFTNIDELKEGDIFLIETLGKTLTYEVDQIRIVLPYQLEDIEIVEGEDYCTLVTCTPYGVNTHRLLVRGHRNDNASLHVQVNSGARPLDNRVVALSLTIIMIVFFTIAVVLRTIFQS